MQIPCKSIHQPALIRAIRSARYHQLCHGLGHRLGKKRDSVKFGRKTVVETRTETTFITFWTKVYLSDFQYKDYADFNSQDDNTSTGRRCILITNQRMAKVWCHATTVFRFLFGGIGSCCRSKGVSNLAHKGWKVFRRW